MRTDLWNVLNAPWAIIPEKLFEIREIYGRHLRGEGVDLAAIEARIGKPLSNQQPGYSVENGVAILPITGVILKRMNLFSQISGGTSTQIAQRDFQEAVNDPSVQSIVLLIDSPGGGVDGVEQFANAIFAARDKKPVMAVIDGMGASAAYWLASAATSVFVTSKTAAVGSIGVVATHTDLSGAQAQRGVKLTDITAGKYKRVASENAPLTEEGRASIQNQVDAIYSVFVDAVAKYRGTSAKSIADTEGKLFIGEQAIKAGLVDGIETLDVVIAQLEEKPSVIASAASAHKPEKSMRQIMADEADRVRRQPWGQTPAAQPQAAKPAVKVEPPIDANELARAAQALEAESAQYGVPIKSSASVDHVLAKRAGKLNLEQMSHEAALERGRMAARGIAISMGEAFARVQEQRSNTDALL